MDKIKLVYIIPWYKYTWEENEYKFISQIFNSIWIEVKIINIQWKYQTMFQYIEQFKKQINNNDEKFWILGFSYGAMISFISSVDLKLEFQILCSLTPFFNEDLNILKKSWIKLIWKRQTENFRQISFDKIAKQINCKTIVLAWDKEWIEVLNRIQESKEKIKNSEIYILSKVKHNLWQKEYLDKLELIIKSLKC